MGDYLGHFAEINGLPFLACLVVSGILVYLGMHVVERKVIFVDLALAQIAALGVMWSILMGYDHETDTIPVTLYSLAFTAAGAIIFSITRTRNERVPHEALIGIIYVAASAAGLVLADRFALGTEALKELIAGRVALVTPEILVKLAVTCAVIGVVFAVLHRRFIKISADPEAAETAGTNIRAWDFLFYLLFGVIITQCVGVLGVLPVFAYLVIPAVTAAFLFTTVRARLLFGWIFAAVISLLGLETARIGGLDPGPTIVCLFAAVLVLLGIGLFLHARKFSRNAIVRVVGFGALFAVFIGTALFFKKPERTDELAEAFEFVKSGESYRMRQAMASFKKFEAERDRWVPLVIGMLDNPDPVVRESAAQLLGEIHLQNVTPLTARLAKGVEQEPAVREAVVVALRTCGTSASVGLLAEAATREDEPDIAVEISDAVYTLAKPDNTQALRTVTDTLVQIAGDAGAPNAARRDALEQLHKRLPVEVAAHDAAAAAAWWKDHREQAAWVPTERRFH